MYLEQRGLTQLLAVHLEEQLAGVTGEQRDALVKRLADLYAQLLERETDPARRVALEQRSRQLLEQAPARSADDLRLALLRASYRTAEKIAENHRLRLDKPEELETARRTFDEIVPQLQALREQMKESIAALDRRQAKAAGADAVAIAESIDRARALREQCTFLGAWSLYYQDWLKEGAQQARLAEPMFAELLGSESPAPNPDEVSLDLRSNEAVARSILGMALCKSLTSSSATAISWINLLAYPETYEPLRNQAAVWTIAIHLEHREYRQVQDILNEAKAVLPEMPLAWLRLIAVYALEDHVGRDRAADDLVRFAVTDLAARGELQQVLDLATRYGVEALGDTGFALKYVQGVIKYQQARQQHASEEPTFDQTLQGRYREAADALKAAAAESDAQKYPLAAAACKRLIAWCSYFQGKFLDAESEFESAATALTGNDAAEALWMAIVSLDKVDQNAKSPEVQAQLNGLIDRFIAQYPNNANTPKLLLKRSVRDAQPSPEAVAELLAVPPGSEMYVSAQSRAADLLYQLFRNAGANDRMVYAGQFLSVAVPLISQPPARAAAASASQPAPATAGNEDVQRFVVRCRQVLEVALTEGVERLVAARAAFEALDAVSGIDPAAVAAQRDEIDCRRLQERLYAGEPDAAAALAEGLWNRDSTSVWSRLAVRSMFRQAFRVWKSGPPDVAANDRAAALERVVHHGGRVLHEFKDDPAALDRPGVKGYYTAVAEATMALWERTGELDRAKGALFLFDKLLAKWPNSAAFLRSAAVLAEACDQPQAALDHWRRLVAGTPANSDGWYEAKFHQIAVLAKIDPPRAREVMNQHKQLNPDYGPDPWGGRLKGLDSQIPTSPAPLTMPAADGGTGTTQPAGASPTAGDGGGTQP